MSALPLEHPDTAAKPVRYMVSSDLHHTHKFVILDTRSGTHVTDGNGKIMRWSDRAGATFTANRWNSAGRWS